MTACTSKDRARALLDEEHVLSFDGAPLCDKPDLYETPIVGLIALLASGEDGLVGNILRDCTQELEILWDCIGNKGGILDDDLLKERIEGVRLRLLAAKSFDYRYRQNAVVVVAAELERTVSDPERVWKTADEIASGDQPAIEGICVDLHDELVCAKGCATEAASHLLEVFAAVERFLAGAEDRPSAEFLRKKMLDTEASIGATRTGIDRALQRVRR